jgi:uroporphyrinogen decarboxylase
MSHKSESSHLLLRAIRGEAVERPPVWAMRQAGRWDPEFNKLRGKLSFYEFSENAELAARASLLPRRFGVDAIILFYDITTLAVAMGLPFDFVPDKGPIPAKPIRSIAEVVALTQEPDPDRFGHVLRILELVKKDLAGALPVLVFAGAPFTLGSYCIGTGKDLNATRAFIREQEETWNALTTAIAKATVHFLKTLAQAGADAYQLFDSWAGDLELHEYVGPQVGQMTVLSKVTEVPSILFVKECPHLDPMASSGANVISLGRCHDLRQARDAYPKLVFQGNVDQQLLRDGTPEQVIEATQRCLAEGQGSRHIVNLNHGVDKATPVENFAAFVRTVRETRMT